ncbi:glucuronate isomerase, partial [bacterium]|nr:glucuronate isomerase [bacterium]
MPPTFITEDFLLESDAARELYHTYAAPMPIIDYHCHIPPQQVAEDHQFRNMTEAWLGGDHYKWRLMRAWGIPERYITGDADDREKFQKWAETVPHALRNPIYHWNHLELKKPFGIADRLFGPDTAQGVWDHCNECLATPPFTARGIMKQWDVRLICTTDDPVDSLEYHMAIADDPDFDIQALPAFRPDKGMAIESPEAFNGWVDRLAAASDVDIRDLASYRQAIRQRYEFFHTVGCRLSDHGIANFVAEDYTESEVAAIFAKARIGTRPSPREALKFQSAMLYEFSVLNCEMGWTQQYHISAIRNNNRRLARSLGPDVGGDSIADPLIAAPMS